MATTIDLVSGGRFDLGLGAGWYEPEFEAFGYEFGSTGDRFSTLEEYVRAVEALSEVGEAEIAAVEKDGYQIVVRGHSEHALDRRAVAARIRAACLERLRRENILG